MWSLVLCLGALFYGAQALTIGFGRTKNYTENFEYLNVNNTGRPIGARNGLYFGNLLGRRALTEPQLDYSNFIDNQRPGDGLFFANFSSPNTTSAYLSSHFKKSCTAYFQVHSFDLGGAAIYAEEPYFDYGYWFDTNYTVTVRGYDVFDRLVAESKFNHAAIRLYDQPYNADDSEGVIIPMQTFELSPRFSKLTRFTWDLNLTATTIFDSITNNGEDDYETLYIKYLKGAVDVIKYSVTNKTLCSLPF